MNSLLSVIDYAALIVVLLTTLDAIRVIAPHQHPFRTLGLILTCVSSFALLVSGIHWPLAPALFHLGTALTGFGFFAMRHGDKRP